VKVGKLQINNTMLGNIIVARWNLSPLKQEVLG
jgi:hypothetical protein